MFTDVGHPFPDPTNYGKQMLANDCLCYRRAPRSLPVLLPAAAVPVLAPEPMLNVVLAATGLGDTNGELFGVLPAAPNTGTFPAITCHTDNNHKRHSALYQLFMILWLNRPIIIITITHI